MTAATIEWIHLDHSGSDTLRIGDAVSAAAGGLPVYRVVALDERQAWVRDDDHAQVRPMPLSRLFWRIARLEDLTQSA